ncbi:trypsin-like serine protease [Leptothoe sp. ISB3NOV94-8A]|uniref:Serine protease n=1 Tax=Adonisia turfae CCMR0081 TaxID=2292702 RepID=A0A6M0RTS9_9CYAN|nr:trypsin-like serine protease [Adonisia turfae]MDV3347823.1 trypsin-like serine protease [Leptothoe sp. LEGE 181152]NEZ59655.1 serine protease [Adonisia turfae CCMR0081]
MTQHQAVSSEETPNPSTKPTDESLHESVSSESTAPTEETELVSESFDGTEAVGELESVLGFDYTYAQNEGTLGEQITITEEFENLPEAGALEFDDEPESVCGVDNRARISPANRYPWRAICKLIITRADGRTSGCTGWFIGPRTVMTAGHCVYSHAAGGWARRIEVIPGMDAANRPYGSQVGTSFRSVTGWTRDRSPEYDYGAVILPNNTLGNRVGWFGFTSLSSSSLNNLLVNNSGYPGDKPFGTQWFNAGRITRVTNRRLYYMLDTAGGQSGSPVWRYRDGQRHAVGIHAYGGCPNKSTRITRPVFDRMLEWKNLGL